MISGLQFSASECPKCAKLFGSRQTMLRHMRLVKCEATPQSSFTYRTKRTFDCRNCNKKYKMQHSLTRHLKEECGQVKKFKCKRCTFGAVYRFELQRHVTTFHQTKKYNPYKCAICSFTYSRREYLENHMKREHSNWCRLRSCIRTRSRTITPIWIVWGVGCAILSFCYLLCNSNTGLIWNKER